MSWEWRIFVPLIVEEAETRTSGGLSTPQKDGGGAAIDARRNVDILAPLGREKDARAETRTDVYVVFDDAKIGVKSRAEKKMEIKIRTDTKVIDLVRNGSSEDVATIEKWSKYKLRSTEKSSDSELVKEVSNYASFTDLDKDPLRRVRVDKRRIRAGTRSGAICEQTDIVVRTGATRAPSRWRTIAVEGGKKAIASALRELGPYLPKRSDRLTMGYPEFALALVSSRKELAALTRRVTGSDDDDDEKEKKKDADADSMELLLHRHIRESNIAKRTPTVHIRFVRGDAWKRPIVSCAGSDGVDENTSAVVVFAFCDSLHEAGDGTALAKVVAKIHARESGRSRLVLTLLAHSRSSKASSHAIDSFLMQAKRTLRCVRVARVSTRRVDIYEMRLHEERSRIPLTGSTADTSHRKILRYKVEKRLKLPEYPNMKGKDADDPPVVFSDKSGVAFARGYERVLYGDHGSYLELSQRHLVNAYGFTRKNKGPSGHYDIYIGSKGNCLEMYYQHRPVVDRADPPQGPDAKKAGRAEGYADYRSGMFYVDVKKIRVARADTNGVVIVRTMQKPNKKKQMTTEEIFLAACQLNGIDDVLVHRCEKGPMPNVDVAKRVLKLPSPDPCVETRLWTLGRGKEATSAPSPRFALVITKGGSRPACERNLVAFFRNRAKLDVISAALCRPSDVEKAIGFKRKDFCLPLVPVVHNVLATADVLARVCDERRSRGLGKIPTAGIPKHRHLVYRIFDGAAVLVAESVTRSRRTYLHVACGIVLEVPTGALLRATGASVVADGALTSPPPAGHA